MRFLSVKKIQIKVEKKREDESSCLKDTQIRQFAEFFLHKFCSNLGKIKMRFKNREGRK